MRDDEPGLVELLVAVEEQVQVDRARPVARALARAAELALDREQPPRHVVHRAHAGDDVAIVGRFLDPVRPDAVAHVEPHVVEEALTVAPLLLEHAVVAAELEPVQLDRGAHSAAATASASTCSRTSWTRRIEAPRSYASTAADTDAAVELVFASASPRSRPRVLLRETPTSTGRPSAAIS